MRARSHPLGGRRAWFVWGLGALVYVIAMFHRMSLGVASLAAEQRFTIGAATLATFTMLQLSVYLVMQIPTGVLADRFGPRRMLTLGLGAMACGELLFAVSTSLPDALVARGLVGLGDALTYLNVLRLAASWFPRSKYALLASLTGLAGGVGQLFTTIPLSAALRTFGWLPTFAAAGFGTVVVAGLGWAFVRDHPSVEAALEQRPSERPAGQVLVDLRAAWAQRRTRAGLWTHFTLMAPFVVFTALWGYPYLVEGQHLSPGAASALLSIGVGVFTVAAPTLGVLISRHPACRSGIILGTGSMLVLVWTAALAWPGGVLPYFVLVLLVSISGVASAASMLAFDLARDANPARRSGSASGLVNIGGFGASVVSLLVVGLLLDVARGSATTYGPEDFRLAFLPVPVLAAFGLAHVVRLLRTPRGAASAPPVPQSDAPLKVISACAQGDEGGGCAQTAS